MKISLTSISIGDRVNAAKSNTGPNKTDTSSIPAEINPSPGDSTITPIDTSGIDAAGGNVNAKTQEGNRATSDTARKQNNPAGQNLQYDKQEVNAGEQAKPAGKAEDLNATPQPKSKGFKESLIDAQMGSMMSDKSGGDHGTVDKDFGHNNGNPNENIKNQPASEPIRRNKMDPYDNSGNKVKEPAPYPIDTFDKTNTQKPYKAPEQDFGPAYKPKNLSSPKTPSPKVRFTTPKINTPRFK